MTIYNMTVNHIEKPLGYDLSTQSFSWKYDMLSDENIFIQSCRILISSNNEFSEMIYNEEVDWDKACIACTLSLDLTPRTRYFWKIILTSDTGIVESETAWFETGKMNEPWKAKWISMPLSSADLEGPVGPVESDLEHIKEKSASPIVRKKFEVCKQIKEARAYVTGLGLYEMYLNNQFQNDGFLQPGYNHYNYWMQYQTMDITSTLKLGKNELLFLVGDGWYRGRFGVLGGYEHNFGDFTHLLCEIHIEYEDGSEDVITTDESFEYAAGPVLFSSIYDGEIYDATVDIEHAEWKSAVIKTPEKIELLTERLSLPVINKETIKPIAMSKDSQGNIILDMGQNMTGWIVFKNHLPYGKKIIFRFAELLKNGDLCTDNLQSSEQTSFEYISDGKCEWVRPHFSYWGFRFVQIQGFDGKVMLDDFEGWNLYSDLKTTGRITTGHEAVNQLISNAFWSQRDNFLEHPTDCPQRAERLGWTGDAQIYYKTASYFMDTTAFFRKYMRDVNIEQCYKDGLVPFIIPKTLGRGFADPSAVECSSAWSDVATVVPWMMYVYYGDQNLLREMYPGMKSWVDYMLGEDEKHGNKHLYQTGFHFGDWLALDNPEPGPFGKTDIHYIASAYYRYSTLLTSKAADVLGYKEDAKLYAEKSEQIKKSILKTYFDDNVICKIDTQTAYAVAIYMDLLDDVAIKKNGKILAQKIKDNGMHLDTGFVGTPYLCLALTKSGNYDVAIDLLLQKEAPGWLYEVNLGATTIWEAWDALDENGQLTSGVSLNHYAYGSVVEWIFSDVCGIRPSEEGPGFSMVEIYPHPTEKLGYAKAELDTVSGKYSVEWEILDHHTIVNVSIPLTGRAHIYLDQGRIDKLLNVGNYHFEFEEGE